MATDGATSQSTFTPEQHDRTQSIVKQVLDQRIRAEGGFKGLEESFIQVSPSQYTMMPEKRELSHQELVQTAEFVQLILKTLDIIASAKSSAYFVQLPPVQRQAILGLEQYCQSVERMPSDQDALQATIRDVCEQLYQEQGHYRLSRVFTSNSQALCGDIRANLEAVAQQKFTLSDKWSETCFLNVTSMQAGLLRQYLVEEQERVRSQADVLAKLRDLTVAEDVSDDLRASGEREDALDVTTASTAPSRLLSFSTASSALHRGAMPEVRPRSQSLSALSEFFSQIHMSTVGSHAEKEPGAHMEAVASSSQGDTLSASTHPVPLPPEVVVQPPQPDLMGAILAKQKAMKQVRQTKWAEEREQMEGDGEGLTDSLIFLKTHEALLAEHRAAVEAMDPSQQLLEGIRSGKGNLKTHQRAETSDDKLAQSQAATLARISAREGEIPVETTTTSASASISDALSKDDAQKGVEQAFFMMMKKQALQRGQGAGSDDEDSAGWSDDDADTTEPLRKSTERLRF